ncbi:MAG: amidohydrolase/deacetylase family metallohydrolase [Planctomycetota bacterium]|nr:amidohydrolase/deacetylase family metallohydrolase [Planctomycetota bacterium]
MKRGTHGTRREFLLYSAVGSLWCGLAAGCRGLLGAMGQAGGRHDLLIKGGRVVDPSQGLSAARDVAIRGRRIVRLAESIPASDARQVLDARGKIVTPGLIDAHTHVYDGVAPLGIPADPNCIAKGVTTAIDAGSSGAHTFPGFRKYVIDVVETRVRVLLNISVVGQSTFSRENPHGELLTLKYANPQLAVRTIERHRDVILGVKVRLSREIAGDHDLEALRLAKEAADAVNLPVMVHIGDTHSPLAAILARLGKGDLVTHCFHGREGGVLDANGRVRPEVRAAVERGVNLDVGHGAGSFSFDVAERALEQDLIPGTVSSDLHQFNVNGPVFDLATTLSKFLHLGLTLEQVIERATVNPARLFGFSEGLGTLREGAEADVAVFSLEEGDFEFVDAMKAKRTGHRKLVPVATVKAGRIYGSASIPVPDTEAE